ncbi:hypothetical protein SAMN05216588_12466 [Pseudomonas flavescens]|uniref:Phage tail protein n=1 Tax=Phytopseudomonas flavescens TaxID=29435 RepID=A0A1G8NC44_9GAMM|nr:host specificity factor TipJ family phage tail protein [Pseudomonas flavescens]SDI77839.1 hypothetical protein SAMN05216588_12466 [Pseudomonas flavescens]
MIRIYPSRHAINLYPSEEGAAIERHDLAEACTIAEWMQRNVEAFETLDVPPISFDVDGEQVPPSAWAEFVLQAEADVRIYPVPFGEGVVAVLAWAAAAIAAVTLVYALTLNTDMPDSSTSTGDKLDLNPAKANSVKLYQVIREVLGTDRIFPDYVVQPISRFVSGRDVRTSLFLSVGVGQFSIPPSRIRIGETPIAAFGDKVSYTIYAPGEYVGGDSRSENWYSVAEVGGSKAATAGLDLDSPSETTSPLADAVVLAGSSITLIGDSPSLPDSWGAGTVINLVVPDSFTVTSSTTHSVIAGPLGELAPFAGMQVSLSAATEDLDLVVASFTAYAPPVPGTGGSPSSVTASAAPTTYDFSSSGVVWSLTYGGNTRSVSLTADYLNMSGVVSAITSQLSGMGLVAQDESGRLKILEPSSPFRGGEISQSNSPVAVFGIGPVFVTGSASTGGAPEQLAKITLRYDDGQPFAGLPNGTQRLAIGHRQNRYRIIDVTGLTIAVQRLNAAGIVDTGWPGFTDRTLLDFELSATTHAGENWIGPFMGCPEGELIDRLEWDIFFPSGLMHTDKKGRSRPYYSQVIVEWADVKTGEWNRIVTNYEEMTKDGFGRTHGIDFATPLRPLVRVRRGTNPGWSNSVDTTQWYALRGRLLDRPTRYDDVTIIALTVRTGSRLSAQSDRQVSLVGTRLYGRGENRSISAAAAYVCTSLGMPLADLDSEQLQQLDAEYWAPRGETFDHTFEEAITAQEALQKIFAAGMSHLVIEDSMISAAREGVQPAQGMLTPHDQTAELVSTFVAPSEDDYTGVDVRYINPLTFSEEIVECRLDSVDPLKIETYTLDGVHDRTRAWRIGMRRLLKYLYQRITHQTETEMDALAYRVIDHLIFADDIPGNQTISSVIEQIAIDGDRVLITTSERLDWAFSGPSCVIRWQDGSVTPLLSAGRVGSDVLSVGLQYVGDQLDGIDWEMEPPRLLFCSSNSVGYPAMIDSIEPDSNGRCKVTAKQYDPIFYSHDNASPA